MTGNGSYQPGHQRFFYDERCSFFILSVVLLTGMSHVSASVLAQFGFPPFHPSSPALLIYGVAMGSLTQPQVRSPRLPRWSLVGTYPALIVLGRIFFAPGKNIFPIGPWTFWIGTLRAINGRQRKKDLFKTDSFPRLAKPAMSC